MSDQDLYGILGVAKTDDAAVIKKAYRKLARELHPDRNPDNPQGEERFKQVSAAFAVLGDEKKRKLYDEFGPNGLRDGFDPQATRNYKQWGGGGGGFPGGFGGGGGFNVNDLGGFGDLDDILGGLFGGGRRRAAPRRQKGANTEGDLTLSVRQAVEGAEAQVEGKTVRIPPNSGEGMKIRLRGKGALGTGGAGDLILTFKIATPPGYARDGEDLTFDQPLTVSQAVLGTQIELPTPEGTTLKMNIPAGTQSGRRLRVRGRGVPIKGGRRGNLYVRCMVRVPEGDVAEMIAAAKALDAFYGKADQ